MLMKFVIIPLDPSYAPVDLHTTGTERPVNKVNEIYFLKTFVFFLFVGRIKVDTLQFSLISFV